MHREILIACWPYLAALVASVAVLRLLVWLSGARLALGRLRRLHRDQLGGVQSLSFVLTLPLFIMVMMFIVQLSQVTVAKVVVEYAAFAAARSAVVWIPARRGDIWEGENQIGEAVWIEDVGGSDGRLWSVYQLMPGGPKYNKIHLAAATALMPICPSRDVGASADHPGNGAAVPLERAYRAIVPASAANRRIPDRIRNKLAYALENTAVLIEIRHKDTEPPLMQHDIGPDLFEFRPNEFGWQDQVTVTVRHDFALLPGPARILARNPQSGPGVSPEAAPAYDALGEKIERRGRVYVYPLQATVRLSNEGEKSVMPYTQWW